MRKNPFIYMRGLKHAAFTVFCVDKGQKTYWDPQFKRYVPYSSGQQVKRSFLDKLNELLNADPSPVEFTWNVDQNGLWKQGEAKSACDPHYVEQLIGGWMKASKGAKDQTLTRRSPLSISALTPLHALLTVVVNENITFDRTSNPCSHKVDVRDSNGKSLSEEQVHNLLNCDKQGEDESNKDDDRCKSLYRKWIPDNKRATGLFTYDVAIDLRRLFCVSTNQLEPEISSQMVSTLKAEGWQVINNAFGECLLMPKEQREQVIPAIADALLNWHITSNQARTFSLMETLAIAISDNANTLAGAIRAKLLGDNEDDVENENGPKARPIVDGNAGADLYVALPCANYVITESESADAMENAKQNLIRRMMEFDYEHQL